VCKIRLTWILGLLLIPSGVHAQSRPPQPPFEVPFPVYERPIAAPAITASDLAAVRDAIGFATRRRPKDATDAQQRITDPTSRKLVEWAILRSADNGVDFARFQAFIAANPNWPNIPMFRRRAEAMLWEEHADFATIRTLTGDKPESAKGRFALGRALLAQGDRAGAQALVRDAWRTEPMPFDVEEEILETFGDLITPADDKARMEHWLYANDTNIALRAAIRLGGNEPAIVKARAAVNEKTSNAKALIEGLPSSVRQDAGVLFSRIQLLRRAERITEAADLMLSAPHEVAQIYDPDAWWVERRLLARKLLDTNAALKAYRIVRDAAPPIGKLGGRARVHCGLDRASLPQGSCHRRPALRRHRRDLQPDRFGPGRLLARPGRRGDEQAAGGTRLLRASGPLQHRLLRPACPRQARPVRACASAAPAVPGGQARGARKQRNIPCRRNPLCRRPARSGCPDRRGPR
jgi:hypothetical protein